MSWWDENSLNYAFDHIERGSHVVISMTGVNPKNPLCDAEGFVQGVRALIDKVEPEKVYSYGNVKIPELKRLADFVELPTRYDIICGRKFADGTAGSTWLVNKIINNKNYRDSITGNNQLHKLKDAIESKLQKSGIYLA